MCCCCHDWFTDLLAVPKHPYAAMENWGLSVFVEQKILLDADVSSSSYQMELTMVVVHEICHQVGNVPDGSDIILPFILWRIVNIL